MWHNVGCVRFGSWIALWLQDTCEALMYRPRELLTYRCIGMRCSCLFASTNAVFVNLLFVWLLETDFLIKEGLKMVQQYRN